MPLTVRGKTRSEGLTLHQGYLVAAYERDGRLQDGQRGVFFMDTRVISSWQITIDGLPWTFLNGTATAGSAGRVHFVNPDVTAASGKIAAKSLGLDINRHLNGGLHEDIDIANHSGGEVDFLLRIDVRGDFADIFEVKGENVVRRAQPETQWSSRRQCLTTRYCNGDFSRGFRVTAACADSRMVLSNGSLAFRVKLPHRGKWHACLLYDFSDGTDWYKACDHRGLDEEDSPIRQQHRWIHASLRMETSAFKLQTCYEQALEDLSALRLPIKGTSHLRFVPAAGLPWFVALFGRDSLVASLQAMIVHPEFPLGALQVLGELQAQDCDDYRDEQPGKILHELRRGELAHFRLIPQTPYYGTADATPLYLIALHNTYLCNGDRDLLRQYLPIAERCLSWIDDYGDMDGDGFQEYQTRSPDGYENQGWKDSGQAIVGENGKTISGPKALCELQGYVYDAWRGMALIYDELSQSKKAARLQCKAEDLFHRFNARFWNEKEGCYALALDGSKRPVSTVASNFGQCLWSGIVPQHRAKGLANRLMQGDMWSGWGVRTLSASHRAYNPYHYQVGSVWPHDNGLIALGLKRYGLADWASRIAKAILDAGFLFARNQMPELYAGVGREPRSFPVCYRDANSPQAWAAGSIFSLLQALVGFQPDAPNERLYLDPALPDWIPDLTLRNLRVGQQRFDIAFSRNGDRTAFKVLSGQPRSVAFRPMSETLAAYAR